MWLRAVMLAATSVACPVQAQPAAPTSVPALRPTMVLLLPGATSPFARSGAAVRDGFLAAHKVGGEDVAVQVIELADGPEPLAAALAGARERGARVVVGPLPRAAVTQVFEGAATDLPLLALNFPETDATAPANLLATALSLEVEAQRMARVALAEFVGTRPADARPRIAVVAGPGPLERRIAQAYLAALRAEGEVPRLHEWTPGSAVVRQLSLPSLEAVFLALNARDAAQVRAFIPRGVGVFGTSLLNVGDPRTSPDAATLAHDLDGVRFVDMPWLLEADHSGVLVYPPPAQPGTLEQLRLYAFGIDAYRLALGWMRGEQRFEVDGVTGRLRVDRGASPRVQRTPLVGTYRGGELRRIDVSTR